ncbi:DUF2249 domain-containing protein [Opitutus sp. ER46]|uniref:DUF2249 domain-containing protein n=1 Tax=Opitutus sp. ER46 TaxID=2161864 RepID=UPI000D2FCBC6|nr:DUF2249 domain-containing protein [Opitutus sp. ER46]PTY00068.1 hypothetical protein DB354_01915 [Opitutus sp. ER46]
MSSTPRKVRTLDVRPLIAQGEEPLASIMATVRAVAPGESFVLISPFLPSPLIERLQSEGFTARPEHRSDGGWQTQFTRPAAPDAR